jgi:hypothetical protein
MDAQFANEFYGRARQLLLNHPRVRHKWKREPERAFLEIPAARSDGFDVRVNAGPEGGNVLVDRSVVVGFSILESYDSVEEVADRIVAFIEDLLSPSMRLRIQYRGRRPSRWILEKEGRLGAWERVGSQRAIWYNWFGQASERVFQNRQLAD